MNILALNIGSTSIKYTFISYNSKDEFDILTSSQVSGGYSSSDNFSPVESIAKIIDICTGLSGTPHIDAYGFRIVHGADHFFEPTELTPENVQILDSYTEISPLHNPPVIQAIKALRDKLGPDARLIGVFDTAFHRHIPDYVSTYALPQEINQKYHLKRYGFHGLAHQDMLEKYAKFSGLARSQANILTIQLGSGCSICAIKSGISVDTSMGFTPMEGLIMRTRPGDLDPGILEYLIRTGAFNPAEIEEILNHNSGLTGIGGHNGDMIQLVNAYDSDKSAKLAIDMFSYRIQKYIGAYLTVTSPLQAIVFGGGIGENSAFIRAKILENPWFKVDLDQQKNYGTLDNVTCISLPISAIRVYVVKVDESRVIAESVASLLNL